MKNIFESRIERIREEMRKRCIDIFMVFSGDYHGSEYVSEYFKCREYLSGFTGSAGTLVITDDKARLWTDGRYFLQAEAELEGSGIILMRSGMDGVSDIDDYLKETVSQGDTIGFDGRTVGLQYIQELADELADANINFDPSACLTDIIWDDRPLLKTAPVFLLDEKYAGEASDSKIEKIRKKMELLSADSHIITTLDDIAWILNLRGSDIPYNPVFLSYLLINRESIYLYTKPDVCDDSVCTYLKKLGVSLRDYDSFENDLDDHKLVGGKVLADNNSISVAVYDAISDRAEAIWDRNPSSIMKAKKNSIEMENERQAHIKDGTALTKMIYRLKKNKDIEKLTELDVAAELKTLREEQEGFIEESFAAIVATGENSAVIHYEPDETTNTHIKKDTFLLMDTGGHYYEGTTDVTRTVAIGTVTYEMKKLYTAVLKGNLRLAAATVKKCGGTNIDILARTPLWELGYDYRHGTGHGVGYLLNVHEGPQSIRIKRVSGEEDTDFAEGMLTSDEPGVYLPGEYGIRLENLMLTVPRETTQYGDFLQFETLTLAPFDKECILTEDMTAEDLALLRSYYAKVREKLIPHLSSEEKEWLLEETEL